MSDLVRRFLSIALLPTLFAAWAPSQQVEELQLVRALVAEPVRLTAATDSGQAAPAGLAAGTDVSVGFALASSAFCADASLDFTHVVQNHIVTARLAGVLGAIPAIAPGATASLGRVALRLQWQVPQPMRLRFGLSVDIATSPGTSPMIGEIDLLADGRPDLRLAPAPGVCGYDSASLLLDVPAGRLEIGLLLTGDIPAIDVPTCLAQWGAVQVTIQPAHVELTYEGVPCGGSLYAEPLLDGESVRFFTGTPFWGGVGLLVLGGAPVAWPLAPWSSCSLLVTPDVVLPVSFQSPVELPLARLGSGHLYAQGILLHPPTWSTPLAQANSTQRLVITLP